MQQGRQHKDDVYATVIRWKRQAGPAAGQREMNKNIASAEGEKMWNKARRTWEDMEGRDGMEGEEMGKKWKVQTAKRRKIGEKNLGRTRKDISTVGCTKAVYSYI